MEDKRMLEITIPAVELWAENKQESVSVEEKTLKL